MSARRPLRVCIDARFESGLLGGVEQVLIGVAAGLSRLTDGDEEYLFLTTPGKDEWIQPFVGGPCSILHVGQREPTAGHRLRRRLGGRVPSVRPVKEPPAAREGLVVSDGTAEMADADVVHFLCQMAFLTDIPSIYHPHDLQHLHLPELFTPTDLELRELWYRAYCDQASLVLMLDDWGRRDLIRQYGLPEEKVAAVGMDSVLAEYPEPSAHDLDALRAAHSLPETFLLYPAQTWPHKNHELLLRSLARVRDERGVSVPMVCPGHRNDHYRDLAELVRDLGLSEAVWFPGFVSPLELRGLYELARGLVFPSLFEGFGLPVCEAFNAGVPVASASSTGLPELVADAGLLFDPSSTEEIAEAIHALWSDAELRQRLAAKGRERATAFSFDRAVRTFRAHYRRIAGRPLSAEDERLVAAPVS